MPQAARWSRTLILVWDCSAHNSYIIHNGPMKKLMWCSMKTDKTKGTTDDFQNDYKWSWDHITLVKWRLNSKWSVSLEEKVSQNRHLSCFCCATHVCHPGLSPLPSCTFSITGWLGLWDDGWGQKQALSVLLLRADMSRARSPTAINPDTAATPTRVQ